jgi:hypothetical protein
VKHVLRRDFLLRTLPGFREDQVAHRMYPFAGFGPDKRKTTRRYF